MNRLLEEEEFKYQRKRENAINDNDAFPTAEAKEKRLTSLKASNATSKSIIRRKFGVTMRMRDREKQKLAKSSPAIRPEIEAFRRTSNGGPVVHTSSPASSFSPINAGRGSPVVRSPPNAYEAAPGPYYQPQGSYTGSPYSQPPYGPGPTHPNPTHNALKRSDLTPQEPYAKRQRMTPPAPGAQMIEVASEDAASHIARMNSRKVPGGHAQAKWNALQPGGGAQRAALGNQRRDSASGSEEVVIMISSSESEREIPAVLPPRANKRADGAGAASGDGDENGSGEEMSPDQPLPSVEDEKSGSASATASPRGGMRAKRGGYKGR
jgi:hypothetical protein